MARKSYIDGPCGQIHVTEYGDGIPIIMHHQAPADSAQFWRAAPFLAAAGMRAILVDAPGFGNSDAPSTPPSIADYAAATIAVIDEFDLGKLLLLGHHTGAMIVTEAALNAPEKVAGVILNGPLPLSLEEREQWHEATMNFEKNWTIKEDGTHFLDLWQYVENVAGRSEDLESYHWLVTAAARAGPIHWYGHNACFQYDHRASLTKLAQQGTPALILTNTGDVITELAERAHNEFPSFDYVCLNGGTIDVANEKPEAWSQAVIEFAKRVW